MIVTWNVNIAEKDLLSTLRKTNHAKENIVLSNVLGYPE